jgi:Rrf2 family protein
MKISTQSRYGVRAVFDVARNSAGRPCQVRDIAARQSLSPRYIEQIFQKLKRAGIIRSVRGPSGGYCLAKKPEEISVGDVVRAAEGAVELVSCLRPAKSGARGCDRIDKCLVRDVWAEASARLMAYLDSVSIEDLCKEAGAMPAEQAGGDRVMYHI